MRIGWTGTGLLLSLVLLLPSVAAAADVGPVVSADPGRPDGEPAFRLWLKGPFGTVPGGPIELPATSPPDGAALDTWMRRATLELATEVPVEDLEGVRITSRPADGDGPETEHALSDRWFEGPDDPGLHLLRVRVRTPASGHTEQAWLLQVPDREGSWETLLEMPAPEAELRSQAGAVTGERGHGCYVGMCQEVGFRPPAQALEPVVVEVGETPHLHLGDGSAMVHWQGQLEPLPGTVAEDRAAEVTFADEPVAGPELSGLEPTAAGEWLLEVRVDYDRDRGWQWFLFRLVAP